MGPNNSFKPTAGVGQLIKQPSRAGGGLILVLGPILRVLFVLIACLLASSLSVAKASGTSWDARAHDAGETYPTKQEVLRLLGRPSERYTTTVRVSDNYVPYQSLRCLHVPIGTTVQVLVYRVPGLRYFYVFAGNRMTCFSSALR